MLSALCEPFENEFTLVCLSLQIQLASGDGFRAEGSPHRRGYGRRARIGAWNKHVKPFRLHWGLLDPGLCLWQGRPVLLPVASAPHQVLNRSEGLEDEAGRSQACQALFSCFSAGFQLSGLSEGRVSRGGWIHPGRLPRGDEG